MLLFGLLFVLGVACHLHGLLPILPQTWGSLVCNISSQAVPSSLCQTYVLLKLSPSRHSQVLIVIASWPCVSVHPVLDLSVCLPASLRSPLTLLFSSPHQIQAWSSFSDTVKEECMWECEIDSHMHSFNQCFYWCLKQPSAQTETGPKVKRGIPLDFISVHLHILSHSHTHVHIQTPIDLTGLAGESTSSLVTLEKTGQPGLRGWRCEEREMVGEWVAPKLKVRSITSNIQDKLSPSPFHLQPWTAEQSL